MSETAYTPREEAWINEQAADPSIKDYEPPPCACIGSPFEATRRPCRCELLAEAARRAAE